VAQVDIMDEVSLLMKSPTKLKMGLFLAEMVASAPMDGAKLESMSEIQLDGTGKATPNDQTQFLMQTGWNNLLNNVASLKSKMDTDCDNEGVPGFTWFDNLGHSGGNQYYQWKGENSCHQSWRSAKNSL
jgi:hypothetical protein